MKNRNAQNTGFNGWLSRLVALIFLLLLCNGTIWGQNPTSDIPPMDEKPDSIPSALEISAQTVKKEITFSSDSLSGSVLCRARDSIIYDFLEKKVILYGEAETNYGEIVMKAAIITFYWDENKVEAQEAPDPTGKMVGTPEFEQGEQKFTARRVLYNFKTGKGKIYDNRTQQDGLYILSDEAKFVRGTSADTSQAENVIYNSGAIITSCSHPEPHFGIRSNKQKIIPNKLVVIGPSNVEIMGVPTPLWLPFGFFPMKSGRKTGLIFPNNYTYLPQWGYGLDGIGWFFPLGEHLNLALTSRIYLKGTWGVQANSNYIKRYKYSGGFNINFDSERSEVYDADQERFIRVPQNSISIRWNHNQDPAAHPNRQFNASVNLQTNNLRQRRYFDPNSILESSLNSNISYNKTFPNSPFSLAMNASHSQNTQSRLMTMTLPSGSLRMQSIYPFRRKKPTGATRWYENIVFDYNSRGQMSLDAPDSTFFQLSTLQNNRAGIQHNASSGTSFKILKHFSLNPSVSYNETWFFNSINKSFDPTVVVRTPGDTLFGQITNNRVGDFDAYRNLNFSTGLITQLFSTLQLQKGPLRGLRWVMKPSVSLNYSPTKNNERYFGFTPFDTRRPDSLLRYSRFENGVYSGPSLIDLGQFNMSYNINNIIDGKYFSRKDSTVKKMSLIDGLNLNGSVNLMADTLKFSPINFGTLFRFFKGAATINVGGILDPYETDESGRRINQFVWDTRRQPLRLSNAGFNVSTPIPLQRLISRAQGEKIKTDSSQTLPAVNASQGRFLGLFTTFSANYSMVFGWQPEPGTKKLKPDISASSLNISGSVPLSKYWNINLGSIGYDFTSKQLTYPYVSFTRDLHCWQLDFSWSPQIGAYSFSVRVKPGTPLEFLKLDQNRNNVEAGGLFKR